MPCCFSAGHLKNSSPIFSRNNSKKYGKASLHNKDRSKVIAIKCRQDWNLFQEARGTAQGHQKSLSMVEIAMATSLEEYPHLYALAFSEIKAGKDLDIPIPCLYSKKSDVRLIPWRLLFHRCFAAQGLNICDEVLHLLGIFVEGLPLQGHSDTYIDGVLQGI